MIDGDRQLEAVAAAQQGVFSRTQAVGAGFSTSLIRSRLESRRWVRHGPTVFGYPGHPDTWIRRLWIAHLGAGPESVVSFEAAGQLHGLTTVPVGVVSITVPHRLRRPAARAIIHRVDDLGAGDVQVVDGLPVTSLARTAVDLAAQFSASRLHQTVEQMLYQHREPIERIGSTLGRIRRSGKPGVRRMELLLDRLGPGDAIGRSHLEGLLDVCLARTPLPTPLREHPLPTTHDMTGFVDRCFEDALLIVEADGRTWHQRREAMRRDRQRDIEAATAGYQTLRLMWEDLTNDVDGTAAAIVSVYQQRRILLAGPVPSAFSGPDRGTPIA
jgi:Protein of unknown function (DUF559)